MKLTLFRIVNVLMAVVVLMSSTGFGLIEHSCQMRGKKISRVGLEQTACEGCPAGQKLAISTQPTVKKTNCCQDEQRYQNVDISSSLSQLVAKLFKIVAEGMVMTVKMLATTLISWLHSANASIVTNSPHAPPAAYGRSLLTIVQNFLI